MGGILRGLAGLALVATACGTGGRTTTGAPEAITVYSGRSEKLIGALLTRFTAETGIEVDVRYGDTAELAALILEEGSNSPADVFLAQDAGALGALQDAGRFTPLPPEILERVPERFRSQDGMWVGTSGRVRVIAHDPSRVRRVPDSVMHLSDPRWKGDVGWAPTNGSFQIFVTALRLLRGEDAAREWLRDMKANGAKAYADNSSIVRAIADGEIRLGLVNHYYVYQLRQEIPAGTVVDRFLPGGDPGGLINVAGAGVVDVSDAGGLGERFISFLLSDEGQRYFVEESFEYPLVPGIDASEELPPLGSLDAPTVDLSRLDDLEGTLALLQEVGLL